MIEMRKLRMQVFYTMVVLTVACIAAGLFWRPWILWGLVFLAPSVLWGLADMLQKEAFDPIVDDQIRPCQNEDDKEPEEQRSQYYGLQVLAH